MLYGIKVKWPINKVEVARIIAEAKALGYQEGFKAGRESEAQEQERQAEEPKVDIFDIANEAAAEFQRGFIAGREEGRIEGETTGKEACVVRLRNLFNM